MLQKTRTITTGLMLFLLVYTCAPVPAPLSGGTLQGEITVSGAFALYPLMTRWAEVFQQLNPDTRFDIVSSGAGKGMRDILAGKVNIGMVSREITLEEETQGAYPVAVAKDAVFPLINAANPVADELLSKGISKETLIKIFITGEIKEWGETVGRPDITDEIHIYTRSDICGAAATWGMYLGGMQSDLRGVGKFGDPGIVQALQNDQLGIGYNNLIYAYGLGNLPPEKTAILPLDINGNGQADQDEILDTREKAVNAVKSGLYPAPPSRTLFLVTNGKPEGAVQAFLVWILTEGQKYVDPSGYVQLSPEILDESLQKIR